MEQKTEFEIVYNALINECIYGNSLCLMWKRILEMKEKQPLLFDNGDYFWGISIVALSDASFHRLFKIFDKANGATSIHHYLKEVTKMKHKMEYSSLSEVEEGLREDFALLEKNSNLLKKLETRRNKYYSHLDKNIIEDTTKFLTDNPVGIEDVLNLYKIIGDILNKYMAFYSGGSSAIGFVNDMHIDDFFNLMENLFEDEKRLRIEKLKKEFKFK